MKKYEEIKKIFEENKNEEQAKQMSKYMRNKFLFYGIKTPIRRKIYKEFLKSEKKEAKVDWSFLDMCYEDDYREFQYLVYDYLLSLNIYVTYEEISKIKTYILNKSWWDTIDFLAKVIGNVSIRDDRVKNLMKEWSTNDNIWIRRTAILHQLSLKDNTDKELLEIIIVNCFGTDEFFVDKAIGWALREYSKINSDWVKNFIEKNKHNMSKLSVKEGSKII